jgi:hypothetical protein
MKIFNEIGFTGRAEWEKHVVDRSIENCTLHWFANYQNVPYLESESFEKKRIFTGDLLKLRNRLLLNM